MMKREDLLKTIKDLSHSQGMYGRLLRDISELSPKEQEELFAVWESKNFKDRVDFILYLENGE